ncbi:MAG: nucleotidyltransferase family protein [Clostridia bacterium]|nr:nucleotidyltransferase family protein [Clostridia bacterium]
MNKTQFALLELIKSSLFNTALNLPDDTDWNAVYKEALDQTVAALAAASVPRETADMWQEATLKNTAHYMRVLFEQTNLINLFKSAGIPLVIIKGCAAAMYYPVPKLRTMGDIDFLVREKDFESARELLFKNGYVFKEDFGDDRDFIYKKGEVIFELHKRYSDSRLDIENILVGGFDNLKEYELNGQKFPAFSADINGLILLDHIRHHLYGGLGIRQIIDWMMFLNANLDDTGCIEDLLELAKSVNLLKLCKVLTKMCVKYFGLPNKYPWCSDADDETAEELLNTVLNSGNFGRKDPYVYRPMSSFTQDVHKKGLFSTLQTAGTQNWQAAKKHKFLRPFAWLYQIFRYIKRGILALFRGENLKKDIKEGKKKADFYERLGI